MSSTNLTRLMMIVGLCASQLTGFSAQAGNYFLKRYVDQDAGLSFTQTVPDTQAAEWVGSTTTDNTRYFTNYKTVCDTTICGYTQQWQCHDEQVCHDEPWCTNGNCGSSHRVCQNQQRCGNEQVPQFCQTNCRQEPFTDTDITKIQSALVVHVTGASAAVLKDVIKEVHVGVITTDHYRGCFDPNNGNREGDMPRELKPFMHDGTIVASDNSLLVMKAKGYRLRHNPDWLNLAGFERGDTVTINVQVEPTGNSDDFYSVLPSKVGFPSIHTSSNSQ